MLEQDSGQNREVPIVPTLGGDRQSPAANIVQNQLTDFQQNRQDNRIPLLNGEPNNIPNNLTFNFDIYNQQNRPDRPANTLLGGPENVQTGQGNNAGFLDLGRAAAENAEHALRAAGRQIPRALPYLGPGLDLVDSSNHLRAGNGADALYSAGRTGATWAGGAVGLAVCAPLSPLGQAMCAVAGTNLAGMLYDNVGTAITNHSTNNRDQMFAALPQSEPRRIAGLR